jgi:hypothetical protein
MKVFHANHDGIWHGGISVVVAASEAEAHALVNAELKKIGLKMGCELHEIDVTKASVIVLDNGDE